MQYFVADGEGGAHLRFADDVGGFLGARDMQGNDVGPGQQFIQRLHRHAHAAGGGCRQERVIGGDLHANASSLAPVEVLLVNQDCLCTPPPRNGTTCLGL